MSLLRAAECKSWQQLLTSKVGNYLLNVGPTTEGLIPQPCVDRLAAVGRWLKVNGESIYGTAVTPLKELEWGRCTAKPGELYLHMFAWPNDGQLEVPVVESEIKEAYLLADPERGSLPLESEGKHTIIQLPLKAPNPIDTRL